MFYIQDVLKLKKNNSGAERLNTHYTGRFKAENARRRADDIDAT